MVGLPNVCTLTLVVSTAAFAKVSKAGGKVKFISDPDAKWLSEAGL